jgi:putative drug exporter of the RND superfamily
MHRIVRRIGDGSARRPWVTIGAWAVAAAVVMGLAGTAGGAFVDDFVAPGSQSEEAMVLLEERFPQAAGGSAMAVFAAVRTGLCVPGVRPEELRGIRRCAAAA